MSLLDTVIPDGNKSEATRLITASVCQWMYERGFKPVETEVQVSPGWIADLAGVCVPTPTEAIRLRLIPSKPKSKSWDSVRGCYDPERVRIWRERMNAWKSQLAILPNYLTAIVEVKASRSDFSGDRKWKLPPPSHLCYLAYPSGLLEPCEIPAGWIPIECSESGRVVRANHPPVMHPVTVEQTLDVVHAIAHRRHNATHYERHRQIMKQHRARQAEDTTRRRMSDAIRAVLDLARTPYASVDEWMNKNWIKEKHVPSYLRKEIETFMAERSTQP